MFGGIPELMAQNVSVGGVATLHPNDQFVYYLITKEKYWQKPTLSALRASLESMRNHMMLNDITRVAMPRIGCGLDGLVWPEVKEIIAQVFADYDCTITVMTFK